VNISVFVDTNSGFLCRFRLCEILRWDGAAESHGRTEQHWADGETNQNTSRTTSH